MQGVHIMFPAGVCLRVPFNRVVVKRSTKDTTTTDSVDIAGVSLSLYIHVYRTVAINSS